MKRTSGAVLELFRQGAYREIYEQYRPLLQHMLFIETEEEWMDFLAQGGTLEERPVSLHLSALAGECLCLGGYEGDVTGQVRSFLSAGLFGDRRDGPALPEQSIVLDLDESSGLLEPQLRPFQACVEPLGFRLRTEFDDAYCAGEYFLFVERDGQA